MIRSAWLTARFSLGWLRAQRAWLLLALFVPVAYALLFSAVYFQRKPSHIPFVSVDNDRTDTSRAIIRALNASEWLDHAGAIDSPDQFPRLAATHRAYVCITIPSGAERDIKRGHPVRVAVWVDASNILIGNAAISAASTVLGTVSASIDIRRMLARRQTTAWLKQERAQPIADVWRNWYNPAMNDNYANYMLIGLVSTGFQLLSVLLGIRVGARFRVTPPLDDSSWGASFGAFIGLSIACWIILAPASIAAVCLTISLLSMPWGNLGWLLVATALFALVWITAGVMLSALMADTIMAILIMVVIVMPSLLLSGYTWPTLAMPLWLQIVSMTLPMHHYLELTRQIMFKQAPIWAMMPHLHVFAIWLLIAMCAGGYACRRILKNVGASTR